MKRYLIAAVAAVGLILAAPAAATHESFSYDPPPESGTVSYNAAPVQVSGSYDPPNECSTTGKKTICVNLAPRTVTLTYDAPAVLVPYTHDPAPRMVAIPHDPTPPATQCADGIDNDGDALVDLSDPGCVDAQDNDETNTPPPVGFPNASNTGPSGTLTSSTGDLVITTIGTVIQNRLINGCVEVLANNVTIRNSHIRCNSVDSAYGVRYIEGHSGLLIEDSIVECVNGIAGAGGLATVSQVTMRRSEVFGCENNVWIENDVLLEDNYIHDPIPYNPQTDPHTDSIQMPTPSSNVTIRHNTVYGGYVDQSNFGNSAITTGQSTNVVIDGNLLAGGGHTLRCPAEPGGLTWNNNRFSTIYVSTVGGYGPQAGCEGFPHSGNVIHETGVPVP